MTYKFFQTNDSKSEIVSRTFMTTIPLYYYVMICEFFSTVFAKDSHALVFDQL